MHPHRSQAQPGILTFDSERLIPQTVLFMRWNRPRYDCRKLQVNRCGAKQHRSGIDHSRVDVLTSNIDGLESRGRGNPLANSNDLPVANQHRPVFNHLAGNGVNGAALQNNAPFARRLRKYQGGSQNAEANDPTMVHRHQLYPIGSQLHPFLMNDRVKKVGGVS